MQILRTILTVIFAIDFWSSGFLLGKEQRSFYGGWTCESYHNYGSVIFCTGSSFEYEFLRIVRRKHSCINTRVLFFLIAKEYT